MFDPPKGPWEILPSWRSTPQDRRFDVIDRPDLEDFLRQYLFDCEFLWKLRELLAPTDPVSLLTDEELIETVAWRLATRELVLRYDRDWVARSGPDGNGGDKPEKKKGGKSNIAPSVDPPSPGPAPKTKHWIGVKVMDEDGKPLQDIAVKGEFNDGDSFSVAALAADGTYKTEKIYDGTNCDFTFPNLYDVEWWPQGGSADPALSVTPAPPAGEGDCLLSIADSLNFRNYHSIWDQHQNDTFKKDRPNPNMLLTGDVVKAPDKKVKLVNKPVDQTWIFIVKSKKPFTLRMVLIDKDNKPLNGKQWELKAPISQSGTTGADGLIEIKGLPPCDKAGTLEVTMKATASPPAKTVPAPAAPANPPPYPPPIVAADYKDKLPAPDSGAQIVTWDLLIGGLPPLKTREGTLARLHNLGFGCDPGSDDAQAARAVKAYQNFYLNDQHGSGIPAGIQDDAGKRHDN